MTIPTLETASPTTIRQAAHEFAEALMQDPTYMEFQAASNAMGKDPAAQSAIKTFQAKQSEMQTKAQLYWVTPEDQAEL